MATGAARYAHDNGDWFLELKGDVRHTLCPAINALLDAAFMEPATSHFLVDLSGADAIDSTCLGTLARIANWCIEHAAPPPIIVTPRDDITETLRAVCFDRLFDLRGGGDGASPELEGVPPPDTDVEQVTALILYAHRRLCAIDENNAAAFRDVVEALESDMAGSDTARKL
ncbi:MAG: STAS domain-containing protein [Gammaproteobacteria bacterium]|jgi:anti-anti-sigma factor